MAETNNIDSINDNKRQDQQKSIFRNIFQMKAQMDKRKQQRAMTVYNLANSKFQNALIIARQLQYTSQKIWKGFDDDYIQEFQEKHFFRTTKNKQNTQYLLDCALLCKVFIKSKKKDDIMDIIQKLQLPHVKIITKQQVGQNKQLTILYNQMKQVLCRTCSVLLTFIQIAKHQKIHQYTQKLYNMYTDFVGKYYGPFQFATAKFMHANYLYENGSFNQALQTFGACEQIRMQNCFNEGYVDVLVNSAVCLRELGKVREAIGKMVTAIEISKDLRKSSESFIDQYYLFLAKLYLENAEFKEAYKNYLITYKIRCELDLQNPKRTQIEFNLLFFFKILQKCLKDFNEEVLTLKVQKDLDNCRKQAAQILKHMDMNILNREQFSKYDDFNKKMAHLNLSIPQAFFDCLSSDQVVQLNYLLQKLSACSFQKGFNQLQKASFYQQKKAKELLISVNPVLVSSQKK